MIENTKFIASEFALMKNDIQELYDSIQIKKALQEFNITKISELKEYS